MTSERTQMVVAFDTHRRLIHIDASDDLKTVAERIRNVYQIEAAAIFDENFQIQFFYRPLETFVDLYADTWRFFEQLVNETAKFRRLKIVRRVKFEENNPREASVASANQSEEQMSPQSSRDVHTSVSHPYHIRFLVDLADRQRRQYESDLKRKPTNAARLGGVLLRADAHQAGNAYPTIQFEVPPDKTEQLWSLFIYVLTEPDQDGIFYLHASKGIFDHSTPPQDRFGPIPNSNLVNPHKIELTKSDVERGKHELRLRVCNIRNLSVLRQEKLRIFPEIGRFLLYQDDKLLSNGTTASLHLSSDRYHLGCLLVSQYIVQDRCISHMAIESDKKRKNSVDDQTTKKKKL